MTTYCSVGLDEDVLCYDSFTNMPVRYCVQDNSYYYEPQYLIKDIPEYGILEWICQSDNFYLVMSLSGRDAWLLKKKQ